MSSRVDVTLTAHCMPGAVFTAVGPGRSSNLCEGKHPFVALANSPGKVIEERFTLLVPSCLHAPAQTASALEKCDIPLPRLDQSQSGVQTCGATAYLRGCKSGWMRTVVQ
jgi:hypothetical protein